MKKQSKSEKIVQKTIFATFQILKENGGEMRGKEVIEQIRKRVSFDDYENHIYEKTGYVRWESILNFYTIDCIKVGFLRKQSGIWYLTHEGEEAMQLGAEKLLKLANKKYREWNKNKEIEPTLEDDIDLQEQNKAQQQTALLEQYETQAIEGIREYVIAKNPYEFQDLVAILLKAMGYYIAHIAPKGRDGGIDIIAYRPFGSQFTSHCCTGETSPRVQNFF